MRFALDDSAAPATLEQWRARALAALRGAPFDQLVSTSFDGMRFGPLYAPVVGAPRAFRAAAGPWRVAQRIDHRDSGAANAQALADLEGGADALTLVTRDAPAARGAGLRLDALPDLDDALRGVHLDLIALRVDAGAAAPQAATLLAALVKQRRLDASQLAIDFGCDPVALHAAGDDARRLGLALASTAQALKLQGFVSPTHIADGRVWHDAGASEGQELGLVLASAVETLRLMEAQAIAPVDTARDIAFCLSADADIYLGLAKFRALRLLWARVESGCGLSPLALRLHAETSWRMMSKRDPHVNILRAGAAVFSAGLGGADAITVLPFSAAQSLPDAAARRIARNTSLVFLEEAHLAKVADPAAGAGGFEALTHGLCEAAWTFFQSIEAAGGLIAALRGGAPQEAVAKTAEARAALIASGQQSLTGTTVFALQEEAPAQIVAGPSHALVPPMMPAARDAAPYEQAPQA